MLKDKLADPVHVMRLRIFGACCGILGGEQVVSLVCHIWPGWRLDSGNPVVLSVDTRSDPWLGAQYEIVVGGERYSCSGGHTKLAQRFSVPVRYSTSDPSICRAADVVRSFGGYEMAGLVAGSAFVLFGICAVFLWSMPRLRTVVFALAVVMLQVGAVLIVCFGS